MRDDALTWLLDAMDKRQARNAELLTRFEAMAPGDRDSATLLTYACGASPGCHLLTVWEDRGVRCWYTPAYTPAEPIASEPTGSGAEATEADDRGDDPSAKAGLVDDVLDNGRPMDGVGLALNCAHISNAVLPSAELATDLADATPGQPKRVVVSTRRADG